LDSATAGRTLRRSDSGRRQVERGFHKEQTMAMIPPPEGLSAEDYDAIEAAVVETVRGRWFLAEYTRRSRVDELRQMLDGLARLEATVRDQQLPNDPSIRLLVQRLRDVSQTLESLAGNMRADGIAENYCRDVETQSRAVGGLLRGAPTLRNAPQAETKPSLARPAEHLPPPAEIPSPPPAAPAPAAPASVRARAEPGALTRLDRLSTSEKVALFS
jgi:hypothetical protein